MTDAFLRRVLGFSLGGCCAFMLIGLVALTVADVIGRYVLNAPLPGAFELTELMLGALVFAALPIAAFSEEHVEIDMAFVISPAPVQTVMLWIRGFVSAVTLWVISWRLVVHGLRLAEDGAATNALSIPLAPFGWFAAVMAALSGAIALARQLTNKTQPRGCD